MPHTVTNVKLDELISSLEYRVVNFNDLVEIEAALKELRRLRKYVQEIEQVAEARGRAMDDRHEKIKELEAKLLKHTGVAQPG